VTPIRSRDNPRVKRWAKLASDALFRRTEKKLIVEGPHLVAEALAAGIEPLAVLVSESGLRRTEILQLVGDREPVVLADRVFNVVADADTPAGIAAELALPRGRIDPAKPAAFLEGIQDPSNVGAILRSAAAFGLGEVVLDRACADPWSPRSLRAGQGGHFKLAVRQVADLHAAFEAFSGTLVCTVLDEGVPLRGAALERRLGWILGAEGRGVSEASARRAALRVTIPMAPGSESLNVAAAAAICFYEAFARISTPGGGSAAPAGSSSRSPRSTWSSN
jgi:TrmH family RNA methyltransferase